MKDMNLKKNDKKIRIPLWMQPETVKKADDKFNSDNCKSRSEFIEKAVNFYLGYLASQENLDYLANVYTSIVEAIIKNTENRIARLQFKQAVEISKMAKLLAMGYDFDDEQMKKVHFECVQEVKKLNGIIKIEQQNYE